MAKMILCMSAKCSDMFSGTIFNAETEEELFNYDGYVPGDLGVGSGDYVELKIDLETGKILNWTPITELSASAMEDEEDEE